MMAETTLITKEKKFLVWRIPNFKKVQKSKTEVEKQVIYFGVVLHPNGQSIPIMVTWKCFLSIKDEQPKNESSIGLGFSLVDSPCKLSALHAAVRVQVRNNYPSDTFYKNYSFYKDMVSSNGSGWGYSKFITHDEEVPLTKDETLEINITVHIAKSKLESIISLHESNFQHQLAQHLSKLREQPLEICCKITKIVSKDGKEFPVSRVVLAARSPLFCSMFQSKLCEEKNCIVEVKDIDSEPLSVLLDFFHTGMLSKNWKDENVIEGLVYGAHKFIMEDLKEFLAEVLGLVCTNNNCGKLMGLARTFGMKDAERQLFEYFKADLVNNIEQVISFAEDAAKAPVYSDSPGSK